MYSVGMRVIDCFQGHIINSITFQPYVFGVAAQVFFFSCQGHGLVEPLYNKSKEPDRTIALGGLQLPTSVIKNGWSESREHLYSIAEFLSKRTHGNI